jgi:hypothetical protein
VFLQKVVGLGMAEAGSASHVFDGAPDVSEHQVRHGPVIVDILVLRI